MKIKSIYIFILFGLIIIATGWFFLINKNFSSIFSFFQRSNPFQILNTPQKDFEIVDEVYNSKYDFNSSVNNNPKIANFISGTDIENLDKKIVITSDESKIGASNIVNKEIVSGYGHEIDYSNNLVYLYIYINPDIIDENQVMTNINWAYIGALLSAAEKNKMDRDSNYKANYTNVAEITHEISGEYYDSGYYFISKKK